MGETRTLETAIIRRDSGNAPSFKIAARAVTVIRESRSCLKRKLALEMPSNPTHLLLKGRFMPKLIEVARKAGHFKTLIQAVQAAGLTDALEGDGPFTLFAPNDAAFAKVPKDTLAALLADKDKLTKVLTYHVAAGKYEANDVMGTSRITTLEGGDLEIDASDGVKVDEAHVTQADLMADNGVIHEIDQVILPERLLY